MISRRRVIVGAGTLLAAVPARAQYTQWPEWMGSYAGAVSFHRSIPLDDVLLPSNPRIERDDRTPFGIQFSIRAIDDVAVVWLRIDGGPAQTSEQGETMRFGPLIDGVALLASADARPAPRSATLTVRSDQLGTEALFSHADGSFWRRHFTANFVAAGADVILWVFDAAGTRARTWRGSALRRS